MAKSGICQLTGVEGRFVKAHIIPTALTRPPVRGVPYVQGGEGSRPIRRWTSWYDGALVTAEGEKILSDLDQVGIGELRRLQLIWSAWSGDKLTAPGMVEIRDGHGFRTIDDADGDALRLFMLSVLWRAAATKLPEFARICLRPREMQKLREMIVSGNPEPRWLFPIVLMQMSTRGPWHNHAPITGSKFLERQGKRPLRIRIIRFFFDGLMAHIHRDRSYEADTGMGSMQLGSQNRLGLLIRPFESSFQQENLSIAISETVSRWPDEAKQLLTQLSI